jgi:hypothetical protein
VVFPCTIHRFIDARTYQATRRPVARPCAGRAESRFGRYADDAVVQCVTERQASALVAARLGKDGTRRAGCA